MNTLEAVQNALQAAQTAREGGDMELAMIEAHNLIDAASEYALEVSREFIQGRRMHGTSTSVVASNTVRKRS